MKKPSKAEPTREVLRQSIIGLGERSIRKSYYPELQQRIAELERSNTELQNEINERKEAQSSAKKLTRQLQQSQKMEAIGTLAGGIAHDFNNILSAIIGFSELAQLHIRQSCRESDCPAAKDLSQVLKAADRARELVRHILTFSRKQDYEKKPLHLATVIKDALVLLRSSLPQSITIIQKIHYPEALVEANETQIHQIIMNLGTNAYHAMPATGGVLSVELELAEIEAYDHKTESLQLTPGPYLLLKICDNGCGMPRSMLDRIFDPYFTTKPKERGTGMGLAVVHGIVKNHDGIIRVYSEPGTGTSFVIYLPQIVETATESEKKEEDTIIPGSEKILLVDDELPVIEMHKRLLESLGYNVTAETDPLRGLEIFADAPRDFDLIMTDMTMPLMDGATLTQNILQMRSDIPVILCTGFSELINEKKAHAIGVKAFAMKPLVRKTVAKMVREALDGENPDSK